MNENAGSSGTRNRLRRGGSLDSPKSGMKPLMTRKEVLQIFRFKTVVEKLESIGVLKPACEGTGKGGREKLYDPDKVEKALAYLRLREEPMDVRGS